MKKVGIIEDNPYLSELFEMAFAMAGFEVVTESTGIGGKNLALSWKPDILLLDVMMPDLDGLQVLGQIRSSLPDTYIVMCSNLTKEKFADEATALGADLIIDKSQHTPPEVVELVMQSRS